MERKKGSKYRRTIFFYFMAIAVVPLLLFGVYAYQSASSALRENIRRTNETALMQVENRVESVLHEVRQDAMRLAVNSQLSQIINQDIEDIPYQELRNLIDEISGSETYINYLNGYSLINYKKGWVLSNKGMMSMQEVSNPEWLRLVKEDASKVFWINHAGQEEGRELIEREHVNNHYLTFVVKVPTYTPHTDSALVLNLKESAMEDIFEGSLGSGSLLVFDQNGLPIYGANHELQEFYRDNPQKLDMQDNATAFYRQDQYDVVMKKASVSGWTFIAAHNSDVAQSQLRQIPITMCGIMMAVLVLSGIISSFGTFQVYRPVKTLMDRNDVLSDMIERQKGQLAELFAMRLIRGRMSKEAIQATKERLGFSFQPSLCVVAALFCQNLEGDHQQMEQDLLNLELLEGMPDEIREILAFPPFVYTRAIVMILDGESKERVEQKLLALRNCLSVYASGACGGYLNMGVSQLFGKESGFQKAYHESLEALKINERFERQEEEADLSIEDSSITYYADLIGQKESFSGYNLVLDAAIKEAVDAGDQERAFTIVEEFLRDMNKSKVVLYEQHYYRYRFLLAILSVPTDAGIPIHDLFPKEQDDLFAHFSQLYDNQAVKHFYENQVIIPVIQKMNQFRKSSSEVVMEKIMNLIASCQGDLTLSECAERLGYHPSYIWRVMKQTQDVTFTDYIAEQKLELATKMLLETELSVAEIAEKMNYSNAQNFIRVFKKHKDVTPGQFRKQNKE